MKILILIIGILLFSLTGCGNEKIVNENSSYNTQRQLASVENNNISNKPVQTELSSFSTTIYTKTEERQNNVKLCCEELNNSIVAANETFSFCETLRTSKTRRRL